MQAHETKELCKNASPLHTKQIQMQTTSLSSLIAGFKSSVTTKINRFRGTPGTKFWQRNYYEHVIRNEKELFPIRE